MCKIDNQQGHTQHCVTTTMENNLKKKIIYCYMHTDLERERTESPFLHNDG